VIFDAARDPVAVVLGELGDDLVSERRLQFGERPIHLRLDVHVVSPWLRFTAGTSGSWSLGHLL